MAQFYPDEDTLRPKLDEELKRAAVEGHFGNESWHAKKDGSRFWANVITMALKDENGDLQGFAKVVRDFSDRHAFPKRTTRSSSWSDTAARICWKAGCTGLI